MESTRENDSTVITIEEEPLLSDWIDTMKRWPTSSSELTHQVRRMSLDDKFKHVKSPIHHRRRTLVAPNTTMRRILCQEKFKVKTAMDGNDQNGNQQNDEEVRQQREIQAAQQAKFLAIANEAKRRKLMKRSSGTAFNATVESDEGKLTAPILYTHSGIILRCPNNTLDNAEFQEFRNNLINPILSAFFPTDDANIVQDFSTVANVPMLLLPSPAHRNAILHLNTSMDDDARTTSTGKTITIVPFTMDELKSIITVGTNFTLTPTIQPTTVATLKSLDQRLNPDQWVKMTFGTWSATDLNFATFHTNDTSQADAIQACNAKLYARHSRHERGSETITISSAYEKFLSLIIHPHDIAIANFERELNLTYSETRSGIIKMVNLNKFGSEEAMINVFMVLPRRKLNNSRHR